MNLTPSLLVHVGTKNDRNGNPRRGWVGYNSDGDMVAFTAEGYEGLPAVRKRFPDVATSAGSLTITVTEYNRLKRWEAGRVADGVYAS